MYKTGGEDNKTRMGDSNREIGGPKSKERKGKENSKEEKDQTRKVERPDKGDGREIKERRQ